METSFLTFQASYFSIKNRSKNHVVLKPLLGPPFSHFFLIFFKNGRFWDPLRNPMGVNNGTKIAQEVQKGHQFLKDARALLRSWRRLAPRIVFGAFLVSILMDFRWIWDDIWMNSKLIFGDSPLHFFLPASPNSYPSKPQEQTETCTSPSENWPGKTEQLAENLQLTFKHLPNKSQKSDPWVPKARFWSHCK